MELSLELRIPRGLFGRQSRAAERAARDEIRARAVLATWDGGGGNCGMVALCKRPSGDSPHFIYIITPSSSTVGRCARVLMTITKKPPTDK